MQINAVQEELLDMFMFHLWEIRIVLQITDYLGRNIEQQYTWEHVLLICVLRVQHSNSCEFMQSTNHLPQGTDQVKSDYVNG